MSDEADNVPDHLMAGLEAERAKLEQLSRELSASLSPEEPPEAPPRDPFNSDAARDLGAALAEVLGRGAISLVRSVVDGRDHPPGPRPRSRFTSPTPRTSAVVAVTPPPAASASPAPTLAPSTAKPELPIGITSRPNTTLGSEHAEDRPSRLGLDESTPRPTKALRGPLIGGSE